ncbi:uncharacterized protein [Eurosta solidaginis]|uniref:uncharacterized protein n=1 Tax=Eurosta solidaginis TaxID=178769 RepID=UPI00353158C8
MKLDKTALQSKAVNGTATAETATAETATAETTTATPTKTKTMRSVAPNSRHASTRFTNINTSLGLAKKKSCTALLCELTCLKSQQKYLECSQVKLNPDNFVDQPQSAKNKNGPTAIPLANSDSVATQLVNDIENLKVQLSQDLLVYRENSYREVQDLRELVNAIREDVHKPERLSQYTLPVLRERIITINTQLMQLCDKNQAEILRLRENSDKLERDNVVLVKF